jgi:hypothetical protein
MGIKFLCPNGHKLHVKSFLSGKKAICPKCGARVLVPAENQLAAVAHDQESASEDSSADLQVSDGEQTTGSSVTPARAEPAHASAVAADPMIEAPTAVWYVRPATGGQFGPASGEIMRAWLHEGRVGASSLVWRAGWPDWQPAASVFPQLGALLPSPGVLAPVQPVLPVGSSAGMSGPNGTLPPVGADVPLAHGVRRRRKSQDANLIASGILVVVSIILVIVLVLVWKRQASSGEDETEPTPPAREVTLR